MKKQALINLLERKIKPVWRRKLLPSFCATLEEGEQGTFKVEERKKPSGDEPVWQQKCDAHVYSYYIVQEIRSYSAISVCSGWSKLGTPTQDKTEIQGFNPKGQIYLARFCQQV